MSQSSTLPWATTGSEKPSKAKVVQEFNNGESIYSWRNGLDPNVGSNEYIELGQENKQDYLDIVQVGKGQMKSRVARSTGKSTVKKPGKYD